MHGIIYGSMGGVLRVDLLQHLEQVRAVGEVERLAAGDADVVEGEERAGLEVLAADLVAALAQQQLAEDAHEVRLQGGPEAL